jgi:hypothetical protein
MKIGVALTVSQTLKFAEVKRYHIPVQYHRLQVTMRRIGRVSKRWSW